MTLEELAVTLNHLNGNVQLFMATRNSSFHMYKIMWPVVDYIPLLPRIQTLIYR